jgi:hypothetical protein
MRSTYHLVSEHQNSFQGQLPVAGVEELFQVRTQQVHHQDAEIVLYAKPLDVWDYSCRSKR